MGFFLTASFVSHAFVAMLGSSSGCLTKHFQEAQDLYTERQALYSQAYGEEVGQLIDSLLQEQTLGLWGAEALEFMKPDLSEFHIQYFCEEMVSMGTVPAFGLEHPKPSVSYADDSVDYRRFRSQVLKEVLRSAQWPALLDQIQERLHILSAPDRASYQCLERHMLESMARTLAIQLRRQKEFSSGSLRRMTKAFLVFHFYGLERSRALDQKAVRFQEAGIPIFCQDLPVIPIPAVE